MPQPKLQLELFARLMKTGDSGLASFLKTFEDFKTDAERLDFVHSRLKTFDLLDNKFVPDAKRDHNLERYHKEVYNCLMRQQNALALESCTKVVMKGNNSLATIYVLRAICLHQLGLFKEALEDVERALVCKYPENQVPSFLKNLRGTRLKERPKDFEDAPTLVDENVDYPNVSSSVSVQLDEIGRRCLVAAKDIQVGEVLIVEEPLSTTVTHEHLNHCHECLKLCYNPIPCQSCTKALYCGLECRSQAYSNYHQYECPILSSLLNLFEKRIFSCPLELLFSPTSDQMTQVLELVEEYTVQDTNKLEVTLLAAVIYDLVQRYTSFFEDKGQEVKLSFKNSIVPFLLFSTIHSDTIMEFVNYKHFRRGFSEAFAHGLYYYKHLTGHSCCPNVYKHFHGTKQVYRAFRTIRKGERCVASFGPTYGEVCRKDRRQYLSTVYSFVCDCLACVEDWPQLLDVPKTLEEKREFDEVISSGVDRIKVLLPEKIARMKQIEKFEPRSIVSHSTVILDTCFDILGNKRPIP